MNEPFFRKKGAYTVPEYTVSKYWHSWFSGIYKLEKKDLGIWSHGGKFPEMINNLELKQRPNHH
jgi:hypothetical protein